MSTYTEEWIVVINKSKYILNDAESKVLKQEIASGNRGVVMFKDFSINIAYIEEFYLSSKKLSPEFLLESENKYEVSEEEKERVSQKIDEFRSKFFKKNKVN